MELNLSSFEKAISSLEAIIKRYQNEKEDDAVRDSMIKRFEYCYETSHKILRRFLESVLPSKENWTFNELIRIGNENDLLKSDLEKWNIFREKRNITSSTYDEDKAKEVIAIVPDFYEEAAYLLKRLKSKKDDTNLIDIRDKHLEYIIKTIKKYLKSPVVIYAYGSRAKGKAKKYSDLDLAVDCGGKNIPDDALNSIKSELEESLLPIRVDIIDLNSVSPAFYNAIKNDLVKIIS